jgi:farnesyl diphosphate synthase
VTILGLDESKKEAQRLLEQAISCLAPFGDQASRLRELAHYIVNRDR